MTGASSVARTGTVRANGIEICYETIGDPADPALLLIMGHGTQLDAWEPGFCQEFVARGFFVVRFDNRDVGLSTKFDGSIPDLDAARRGDRAGAVYTLDDMADDAAGLLAALGIDRAHVLGASMGGMIAQTLAVRHPDRVRSLCSIMSTTGAAGVGGARPEVLAVIRSGAPRTRDEIVAAQVAMARALRGGGFPFDEARARDRAEHAYQRCHYPEGKLRQQAAILVAADRTPALRTLRLPAVVIHGADDPLVAVSGGEATAAAIPDARLVVVPGLGHEFPVGVQATVAEEFAATAQRARP
ncbi:alpha/beta hydrolase [Pseudonocardia benzenivorans]|jgi:pimeloyl-ACP methyl ester carboxylesterase|uniref:Alpha/beta hydrolase fold protein n=1 Tax=Pseudonocardia dioxanivorans (strain ATCC 55486 / DSM 44775 / JCM 13855 / CB1190) TaxID=675635 RepID=F4CMH2_PSEUX|nr:alpha/beta hydrolase [Pseudonocardia dioxanivorans]AEA23599.1 alpha/beta hydrolase fold protein [Pseudonocardia dioxanivorans CB1190]GJF07556.1 alpha/beta hydrolase [Pseudonocardia sp. D17]